MKDTTVTLHTGAHCIETAAKNEFRKIAEIILSADEEETVAVLSDQLELLRDFIESGDFNSLRSLDERLSGIKPGCCIVGRDKTGTPVIKSIS